MIVFRCGSAGEVGWMDGSVISGATPSMQSFSLSPPSSLLKEEMEVTREPRRKWRNELFCNMVLN